MLFSVIKNMENCSKRKVIEDKLQNNYRIKLNNKKNKLRSKMKIWIYKSKKNRIRKLSKNPTIL